MLLNGDMTLSICLDGNLQMSNLLNGELGTIQKYSPSVEVYDGATDITPDEFLQTLETQGKLVQSNITVQPIPTNYGLITWNGRTITVS